MGGGGAGFLFVDVVEVKGGVFIGSCHPPPPFTPPLQPPRKRGIEEEIKMDRRCFGKDEDDEDYGSNNNQMQKWLGKWVNPIQPSISIWASKAQI